MIVFIIGLITVSTKDVTHRALEATKAESKQSKLQTMAGRKICWKHKNLILGNVCHLCCSVEVIFSSKVREDIEAERSRDKQQESMTQLGLSVPGFALQLLQVACFSMLKSRKENWSNDGLFRDDYGSRCNCTILVISFECYWKSCANNKQARKKIYEI